MKINVTTEILDEKGEVIKEGSFTTLRAACCAVLYASIKGDEAAPPEKKGRMGYLALLISGQDEVDLKAEDITTIKKRVEIACPPLIVVRVHRLLEGKDQQPAKDELQAMFAVPN